MQEVVLISAERISKSNSGQLVIADSPLTGIPSEYRTTGIYLPRDLHTKSLSCGRLPKSTQINVWLLWNRALAWLGHHRRSCCRNGVDAPFRKLALSAYLLCVYAPSRTFPFFMKVSQHCRLLWTNFTAVTFKRILEKFEKICKQLWFKNVCVYVGASLFRLNHTIVTQIQAQHTGDIDSFLKPFIHLYKVRLQCAPRKSLGLVGTYNNKVLCTYSVSDCLSRSTSRFTQTSGKNGCMQLR